MPLLYAETTSKIIGCFYTVYNTLGFGFLEKVYENAFKHKLEKSGLNVIQQKAIDVFYDGVIVGQYFADIVVENKIILELKSIENISQIHEAQLHNYLKATSMKVGYLMNFGRKAEYKRIILNQCQSDKSV